MSRAPIYAHFTESETHFFCKYCSCKYIKDKTKSTGNLHKHLNRHRRETSEFSDADLLSLSLSLVPPVKREKSELITPFLTATRTETHEQTPPSVPCTSGSQMPEQAEAIVRFFAAYDIPFRLVESDEFRSMFNVGTFGSQLPSCNELVDNYLPKVADRTRSNLKEDMGGLSVALGFNEHTNYEGKRFISVTASFIKNWKIIQKRFDVYPMNGVYYQTRLMEQRVKERLEEYGIDSVVGAVHHVTKEINAVCDSAGWEHFPGFDHRLDLAVEEGFDNLMRTEMGLAKEVIEESDLHTLLPEQSYETSSTGLEYMVHGWHLTLARLDSYLRILPLLTIPEDAPKKPDVIYLHNLSEMLHFLEQLSNMIKAPDAFASLIPYLYLRLTNYCNKPNLDPKLHNFAKRITNEVSQNYSEYYEDNKGIHMCCLFDPRFAFNNLILPNAVWDNLKEELIGLYPDTADTMEAPSTSDDWAPLSRSNVKSKIEVELDLYKADKRLPMPTPDKQNNQDVLDYWESHENEFPLLAKEVHKRLPLLCSSTEPEYAYRDLETLISPTTQSTKPEVVRDVMTIRLEAAKKKMDKNLNTETPLLVGSTHEVTVNVKV